MPGAIARGLRRDWHQLFARARDIPPPNAPSSDDWWAQAGWHVQKPCGISVFTLLLISQAELGLQNSLVRRNLGGVLQKRNRLVSAILLDAGRANHGKQWHIVRRNFGGVLERGERFVVVAHGLLDARELKPAFHKSGSGDGSALRIFDSFIAVTEFCVALAEKDKCNGIFRFQFSCFLQVRQSGLVMLLPYFQIPEHEIGDGKIGAETDGFAQRKRSFADLSDSGRRCRIHAKGTRSLRIAHEQLM